MKLSEDFNILTTNDIKLNIIPYTMNCTLTVLSVDEFTMRYGNIEGILEINEDEIINKNEIINNAKDIPTETVIIDDQVYYTFYLGDLHLALTIELIELPVDSYGFIQSYDYYKIYEINGGE